MVTITVNTLIDENDGIGVNGISLREAVAQAISGDTITFAPSIADGTITLTNGELVIDQSLTIDGDTDNNDTTRNITIDANGSSRVFTVDDSDGSSDQIVTIDGLTITGGSTDNQFPSQGGGIDNRENLSIRNSTISGNFAADGGGIFNFFGSTATITNSTISDNSANLGGGLYSRSATVNISESTISGNSAAFFGGGLYNRSATVNLSDSTISDNSVNRGGGGVYHNFGLLDITNSTISNNSAASFAGGGIQQESGTVNINNSTISGNSGASFGGGIAKFSGTTRIVSTIIATNTASYSPDVGGFFSNQSDQGNNLIGDVTKKAGLKPRPFRTVNSIVWYANNIRQNNKRQMIVYEFKVKGRKYQYQAIDEAILTAQFIRNSCLRYWMDNRGLGRKELYRYNTELRAMHPFARDLNSHACQASVERCWSAIARFFENCKRNIPGKKGYPKFKKRSRSVEYKTSGWKLLDPKHIEFIDKKGIGKLQLVGTWDLAFYPVEQIKRVRLVRRADGYYCQFCISVDVKVETLLTKQNVGLDVGLKEFYTDSDGNTEPNPRFYRNSEKRIKFYQRRYARKNKGSANRLKAINKLGRVHLKISRQREEHAKRIARCVILSNDMVAYEDLRVKNLVKNHCLAKSINDAGWYQFRKWLEYFGTKFSKVTVAVPCAYTSQNCSSCGATVKKSLSTRTHVCKCGCELDRDHNAAINILNSALGTTGHVGTWVIDPFAERGFNRNASGDLSATVLGVKPDSAT